MTLDHRAKHSGKELIVKTDKRTARMLRQIIGRSIRVKS